MKKHLISGIFEKDRGSTGTIDIKHFHEIRFGSMDEEPITPVLHFVSRSIRYVKVSCHKFSAWLQESVETIKTAFPTRELR